MLVEINDAKIVNLSLCVELYREFVTAQGVTKPVIYARMVGGESIYIWSGSDKTIDHAWEWLKQQWWAKLEYKIDLNYEMHSWHSRDRGQDEAE